MSRKKKNSVQNRVEKVVKEQFSKSVGFRIFIIVLVIAVLLGAFAYYYFVLRNKNKDTGEGVSYECNVAYQDANISIHFLELGNSSTGDCVFIKTQNYDILIDCGSTQSSTPVVAQYLNQYVSDGKLEYVIITHAHSDHYSGFCHTNYADSIFGRYTCETIITFAGTESNKTTKAQYIRYENNLSQAKADGANHYTALECVNGTNGAQQTYTIGEEMNFKILDSYYYANPDASNENNNSVCVLFTNHSQHYLFTGDLEGEGEEKLVQRNSLPQVELFKAGHHGSYTANSSALMQVIRPKVVCVCCCAGSSEYTPKKENQFPAQVFINNVAPYTDRVYVTTLYDAEADGKHVSFNGNIMFLATATDCGVNCSNNNFILKSTKWFKENRNWPTG